MPLVRKPQWSDLTPDQQRSYQDEESLNMYWDKLEAKLEAWRKQVTPEEFAEYLEYSGTEWVDD